MKKKQKKSYSSGLSTTIMVDVLFILLIFFILVSTVKKDSIRIKSTKVARQKQAQLHKKKKQHVLTIDKKNRIFINNKRVENSTQLQAALGNIKAKTPQDTIPVILLRPDAGSSSSRLIEILAALNKVGLSEHVQVEVEGQ